MVCWPPTGWSSALKIACGSNIDDIRGNTKFVANCLYCLENSITIDLLKICFEGGGLMLHLSTKKISLKSDTERGKYARLSRLVPIFRVLGSTVKWIA